MVKSVLIGFLIGVLCLQYTYINTTLQSISSKLSYIDANQLVIVEMQRDLYKQIAQCLTREVQINNEVTNFIQATAGLEKLQTEQLLALIKEYTTIEDYVTQKFFEQDKDTQSIKDALLGEIKAVRLDVEDGYKQLAINDELKDLRQKQIEFNILQSVIWINNESDSTLGSGVTILYREKYYIITAAHLGTYGDRLSLSENGQTICGLDIVARDDTIDLMLLRLQDATLLPMYYTSLATYEPTKLEELYTCGNPNGIEDLLNTARIAYYTWDYMLLQGFCYFGSSGGGVFNQAGELVGIVSYLSTTDPNPCVIAGRRTPQFVLDGIVRLKAIKAFLRKLYI